MGVRWETFCSSIYWYQCGARLRPFSVLVLREIQALFGVLTSPNQRNLRRGKPQILSLNGSKPKVPLAAVSGCTGRRSIPRYAHNIQIYTYIYIYIHAHIQTYIYMYLNTCYTVNIHIYIIHIAHRRATLARTQLAHLLKLCSVPRNREINGS